MGTSSGFLTSSKTAVSYLNQKHVTLFTLSPLKTIIALKSIRLPDLATYLFHANIIKPEHSIYAKYKYSMAIKCFHLRRVRKFLCKTRKPMGYSQVTCETEKPELGLLGQRLTPDTGLSAM